MTYADRFDCAVMVIFYDNIFVGATISRPVANIITNIKNKSLSVILSGVSIANAVETRRANGDGVWI